MRQVWKAPVALTLSLLATTATHAVQGRFDGWCFMQDECSGPSVISGDSFGTCEEDCAMTEPTRVTDMQAMLYRVECNGDGYQRPSYRLFLAEYDDFDGNLRAIAVGPYGAEELARCEERG